MKYRVRHTTEYFYGDPVPLGHHEVRLTPRNTLGQSCQSSEVVVHPAPAERRERIDFFGNRATWISIQEPHDHLKIESSGEVAVIPAAEAPQLFGMPWENVASSITGYDPESLTARQYTFDSPLAPRLPELADYARADFPPGAPLLACVKAFNERIYREFTFNSGVTTVDTPVLEVLHHRHGVCQDFAQLAIACLRSLGLPARYVSGYLVTRPPPGQVKLRGADVSHAWFSVFVPGTGWIDFDPTNGILPAGEHVTLGWARDYGDISPVRGVIIGGHRHGMRVSVDVEPIIDPVRAAARRAADRLSITTSHPSPVR